MCSPGLEMQKTGGEKKKKKAFCRTSEQRLRGRPQEQIYDG